MSNFRGKGMVCSKGDPMEDNFGVASDWIAPRNFSRSQICFRLCLMSSLWLKIECDGVSSVRFSEDEDFDQSLQPVCGEGPDIWSESIMAAR